MPSMVIMRRRMVRMNVRIRIGAHLGEIAFMQGMAAAG